jgi:hypothetical protein
MGGHHRFTNRHDGFKPQFLKLKEEVDHGISPVDCAYDLRSVHQLPYRVVREYLSEGVAIPRRDGAVTPFNQIYFVHPALPLLSGTGAQANGDREGVAESPPRPHGPAWITPLSATRRTGAPWLCYPWPNTGS